MDFFPLPMSSFVVRIHRLIRWSVTLTWLQLQAWQHRPQMNTAAVTQPVWDVRPHLNQVRLFQIYIVNLRITATVLYCNMNAFVIVFTALKQSLFESQLEEYANDMQQVYCWLYHSYMNELFYILFLILF